MESPSRSSTDEDQDAVRRMWTSGSDECGDECGKDEWDGDEGGDEFGSSEHFRLSAGGAPNGDGMPLETSIHQEKVLVHVYDLGNNPFWRSYNYVVGGYGAFHTGVEVYGLEWCFEMLPDEFSSGISHNEPMKHPCHGYRETICLGYTSMTKMQVIHLISDMSYKWTSCTYELLTRNCHHFSDTFCRRLGVGHLPSWLNELAHTVATAIDCLDDHLDSADSTYDGGKAICEFFHSLSHTISWLLATDSSCSNGNFGCSDSRSRGHGKPQSFPDIIDVPGESPGKHEQGLTAHDPFSDSGMSSHAPALL